MEGQESSPQPNGQSAAPEGTAPTGTAPGSPATALSTPAGEGGQGGDQLTQPKPGAQEIGGNGGPDWRAMLAGEDAKAIEQLSRYKSAGDFLAAHNELRGKLSQRAEIPKIDENSTADQIAEYRKAFDVPEVSKDAKDEAYAEAYGLKLPEGVNVPPALLGAFAKQMNAAHVSKAVVQKTVGEFAKIQQAVQERTEKINAEKGKQWANELRDKWGSKDYEGRVSAAQGWLQDKFKDNPEGVQRLLAYQAPDGGLLGDDPFFIELFSEKGMGAGYTDRIEATAMESSGRSLVEQQREIESLMFKDPKAYSEASKPGGRLEKIIQLRMSRGEIDEYGNEQRRRA